MGALQVILAKHIALLMQAIETLLPAHAAVVQEPLCMAGYCTDEQGFTFQCRKSPAPDAFKLFAKARQQCLAAIDLCSGNAAMKLVKRAFASHHAESHHPDTGSVHLHSR